MKKRFHPALFLPAGTWLLLIALLGACTPGKAKQAPRAVPVVAATAGRMDVPLQIRTIGNAEAYNSVQVKALVGGEVEGVFFREGQDVRKGDVLFKIDSRPYEAALKQAEGSLARDVAQAKNAEEQAKRYQILVQKDYVSRDQYDQLRANADALAAAVEADRANVEAARLNVSYCTIKSPLNGRAGAVLVNAGNVIKANDLALTTINQISPIYVTFSVPEQNLPDIKRYAASRELKVEARMTGEDRQPARGELTFIDNAVNTATGTIKLKGSFANRDHRLWPGQFVDVVLTVTTEKQRVVVPTAAVQTGQQGQYVFVIKTDLTVEMRPVKTERVFDALTVIASGVSSDERVVTDGQLRLMPGARVEIAPAAGSGAAAGSTPSQQPKTGTN